MEYLWCDRCHYNPGWLGAVVKGLVWPDVHLCEADKVRLKGRRECIEPGASCIPAALLWPVQYKRQPSVRWSMMRIKGSIADHCLPSYWRQLHSCCCTPMTIERLVRSEDNNKMMINVKSWAVTVGALNPALELHSPPCTLSDQQSIHGRSTHSDVIWLRVFFVIQFVLSYSKDKGFFAFEFYPHILGRIGF